nr:DUF1102 domain-containing protein [Halapricum salinum]
MGSLAAGGAAAMGSGAFTSVSANRSISVEVAGDSSALLGMQPSSGPNGAYASLEGGTLGIDFSNSEFDASGVGSDSVYQFDDVFQITNNGTQTIYVWASVDFSDVGFEPGDVYFYPDGNEDKKLRNDTDEVLGLGVGQAASIGVYVDSTAVTDGGTLSVTINATVDKPESSGAVDPVGGDFAIVTTNPTESNEYGSLQSAIDNVSGSTIHVEPGTYEEIAENRDAYGTTNSPYSFGLFVDVDGLTILGVDESGDPITDSDDVQATIVSQTSSPFGTNGPFVAADGVTIHGVELRANPEASPNKNVEVSGDNFTLRHSVVVPNDGGGGVYFNDSGVQSFSLENNLIEGGVTVNNGAGNDSSASNRVLQNNTLSEVGFQGAIDHIEWLNKAAGGATLEDNEFTADDTPPVWGIGTLHDAPWPWATWIEANSFENGGVLAWTGSDARATTSEFEYDYDGDESAETVTYPTREIGTQISEQLDRAATDDTVLVAPGSYEETLTVDERVTLEGVTDPTDGDPATVDGTVSVQADGATVRKVRFAPSTVFQPGGIDPSVLLVTGDDVTVEANLLEGIRADNTTVPDGIDTPATINAIHVFDASESPVGGVVVQDNTVRDIVNDGDVSKEWPHYGGASAIKVQGTVDGVDIFGNTVEDVYSAGWTWGIVSTHTTTDGYGSVSPKSVAVEGNSIRRLNTAGSQFSPTTDPTSAPYPGSAFGVDGNADADLVSVTNNNFVQVPIGAVTKDPDHTLDVTQNWWGDDTGPGTLVGNPVEDASTGAVANGAGSAVSVQVEGGSFRFDPWSSSSI